MAKAIRREFFPSYFEELMDPRQARYESKVMMCDGVDQFTLHNGADTTSDADVQPATTHVDIINYLVLSTNYVSLQQMKAFKALDAYNYFTSGWVKSLTAMGLPSKLIVVLSEAS
ncbi:hypothetical protein HPB47_001234 [Ixodes persulcatus]|uniref:Uncharacterized protein n=1 Tax=Ixodes persulcatus TaxID=34615 RepID=A0AC60PPI2_IXOPE|nr:hypothetical protein HPB47_001234 [Ixodes persulcatus]